MGTAASADLIRITERWGEKFPSDALSCLLRWGRRGGLSIQSSNKTVWERLGCELWKSVAQGDKEVFSLSPVWLTAQRRLEEFEDERRQLQKMADFAVTLERELEQVKLILHQRDLQFESLQQEHLVLMKQLTLTQESLHTKEQSLNDLQTQYDELVARLEEFQGDVISKDDTIQYLQNEKIVLEVALQAAKASKEELDEGANFLGESTEAVSEILAQLSQMENLQQESASLKKQTQIVKEQFLQQKVMVEAYQRDASSQDQLISELKSTKKRLDLEVKELKRELLKLRSEKQSIAVECSRLQKEVSQVHQQIVELESHLQSVQKERDTQIADGGNNQASHERIQALEIELQAVNHSKMMSEKELQEVISLTTQELRESRGFRRKIKCLEEINKKLALELEHERGKLTGLGQSNIALREHSNIPETLLAEREADLVQLNLRVQAVLNIQALQTALEREKSKVNNLQKQVAAATVDAAHNRRHYRAAVLELSEIKKELQAKELLIQTLQAEADKLQAIIERAHASFKALLLRQKGGICSERADALDKTPAARLLQALYVLNWLHLGKNSQVPPAIKHVSGMTGEEQGAAPRPSVKWFDYQQQIWKGPVDLLTWGRGYVCVATDAGPRWMPARWVRPWLRPPE
ncbi:golgin subfamily A member 3-like [Mauremys reevesii]|uniref:golgin subfamily A member 3-like n=1 Tax=Mauremys reevesii TaxID=260615 RepID=UPI0019401CAC|nr:golgin subfamily A member 3-like [Mauremys reevesii]